MRGGGVSTLSHAVWCMCEDTENEVLVCKSGCAIRGLYRSRCG